MIIMGLRASRFVWVIMAVVLSSGIAYAKTCPDLKSASQISGFDLSHFDDREWEITTKNGFFYVHIDPELCLFVMKARMGDHDNNQNNHQGMNTIEIANHWNQEQSISTAYLQDDALWLRSSAYLHNASEKLLAANLFIFDLMAQEFLTTMQHDVKKKTAL